MLRDSRYRHFFIMVLEETEMKAKNELAPPEWMDFELGISLDATDMEVDYDLYYNYILLHQGVDFDYVLVEKKGKWVLRIDPGVFESMVMEERIGENLLQLYRYTKDDIESKPLSIEDAIKAVFKPYRIEIWRHVL